RRAGRRPASAGRLPLPRADAPGRRLDRGGARAPSTPGREPEAGAHAGVGSLRRSRLRPRRRRRGRDRHRVFPASRAGARGLRQRPPRPRERAARRPPRIARRLRGRRRGGGNPDFHGVTTAMRTETFDPEISPSPPPDRPDKPEDASAAPHRAACLEVPELKRLQYFFGQVLGPQDFRDEQSYFREKQKLHNRCLHGFGVVCGLEVVPAPVKKGCDPAPEPRPRVLVRCGLAYDCAGNELVVRRDLAVDLLAHLPPSVGCRGEGGPNPPGQEDDVEVSLWLSLCFCEQPVDPARPVLPDACGASPECSFGKLRDAVRVRVSREAPSEDEGCDGCCSPCADPCVLLARIDFVPGAPPEIHNQLRRPITPYLATRVESVNWSHGARYTPAEASRRLASLELRFSRKVRSVTLQDGVVDVWVIEGGGGRRGNIYNREGRVVSPDTE